MNLIVQHFCDRVIERRPDCEDPHQLALDVTEAVREAMRTGDESHTRRILRCRQPTRWVWRVVLPPEKGGIVYAVVSDITRRAITTLTQEQVSNLKDVIRGRAKTLADAERQRGIARSNARKRHIRKRVGKSWKPGK